MPTLIFVNHPHCSKAYSASSIVKQLNKKIYYLYYSPLPVLRTKPNTLFKRNLVIHMFEIVTGKNCLVKTKSHCIRARYNGIELVHVPEK